MFNELDPIEKAFLMFLKALTGFVFTGTVIILGLVTGLINV